MYRTKDELSCIPFYFENVEYITFLMSFAVQMQALGFTEKQCNGLGFLCYCAAIGTVRPNKNYVRAALETVLDYAVEEYDFKRLVNMCLAF